jgi:hypothetical protein
MNELYSLFPKATKTPSKAGRGGFAGV